MSTIEFIPPGKWKTLFFRRFGRRHAVAAFLSWPHWAVGFEFGPTGFGSILLGPVSVAVGATRPAGLAVLAEKGEQDA